MKRLIHAIALAFAVAVAPSAMAAEGHIELLQANNDMSEQSIKRGLAVFTNVCMSCHSAKYLKWRNLLEEPFNLSREQVDAIRNNFAMNAMNDGLITDLQPADAKDSYGKIPPDLSLITRARHGNEDYVFSLLNGFTEAPAEFSGNNFNAYFLGHNIAMPQPLFGDDITYADFEYLNGDETPASLEQEANDVTAFLSYVGEPAQFTRQSMGKWVLGFLFIFTLLAWQWKRAVWADVKH
ncbi:MAG: cytochrome c1 [Alphaproteobacteria bacterium CG_4_10_14_0_2_um_filter_63_37]|nr:MAG: hypothetical protein AUJ55_01780 [Proteobacteria bacterium CG1_02_64_396]PJA24925.1 MAG: cytochrome c1 [Alphaproteobacteria bacterium CG_4_10_14_0_2_um_filter_63_37]